MKREVILYIQDTRMDLFQDETISLTDTIKNVRDISKVFTTFTKSFSLPASSTNNKLFKHYYNFDIVAGFDGRTKHDARIEINQVPFKDGKIKLEGVDLKNEQPYAYRVTFFGNTVELKDIFKEDKLKDLEFVEIKASGTTVAPTAITKLKDLSATFNDATTGVSEGDRAYNVTDGTYATIITINSAIEVTVDADNKFPASKSYQILLSPFWNETAVLEKIALQSTWAKNSLIVPLITHTRRPIYDTAIIENTETLVNLEYNSGENKGLEYTDLKFALRVHEVIKAIENTYTTARTYPTNINFTSDFFSTTNTNYHNLFLWLARKQGEVQTTTSASSYQFTINSFTGGTGGDTGFLGVGQNVYVSPNEVTAFEIVATPSTPFAYTITIIRNGSDIYTTSSSAAVTITPADLGLTTAQCVGTYQVRIGVDAEETFTSVVFNVDGNYIDDAGLLQTFSDTATSGAFTPPAIDTFDMKDQMPDITVIDFVTGLFKMFNLIAFVNSSKEIEVRTLDNADTASYYYSPTTYDITEYVDIKSKKVDVALPYKEIIFKYKGLKSFLAIKHNQLFNEEWGSVNWNQDDSTTRLSGTTYKVEVPFGHFKYEKLETSIQVGWSVGDSESALLPAPLIFYPVLSGSTKVSWKGVSTPTPITSYNVPSNSKYLSASSGEQNINFGAMINEYALVSFTGTLFQNYYTNYISNIFNTRNRLTKIKARLPLKILLNYTLADLFRIEGTTYRINSITTNLTTGEADIELLNL